MTFTAVTHEPTRYLRNLAHVPTGSEGHPLMMQDLSERYAIVEECARVLHEKFLRHCNTAAPFQRLTRVVEEDLIINLQFLVRLPTHRFNSSGPPPNDDFDVLDMAPKVLERALRKYTIDDFAPWKWFA